MTYFAHSQNGRGDWDPLRVHLTGVAERARGFAAVFGVGDAAYIAGLLHDLGKYGALFQRRLEGKERGLDHWSMGASVCLDRYRNAETAMAVQGHHVGLQWWEREELRKLLPAELEKHIPDGRRLTESDRNVLLGRLQADEITLPGGVLGPLSDAKCAAAMLDLRMLFSANDCVMRGPEASGEMPGGSRGWYEVEALGLMGFRSGTGAVAAGWRIETSPRAPRAFCISVAALAGGVD
jgi:CRISPR-associated endonuclease Cas3-HD